MTKIEWTDETWNVIIGCDKVSPGCQHCYAIEQAYRNSAIAQKLKADGKNLGRLKYYEGLTEKRGDRKEWTGKIAFVPEALEIPLKRKKPTKYFVNSMGDLFHKDVTDEQLDQIFAVMALTPQHTYQVLTKRPARMCEYFSRIKCEVPLSNVWLGVSVEDQKVADDRIPLLLNTPASKRFLSCEPLLGQVEIQKYLTSLDWVIAGAESGHNARPMNDNWLRDLARQCQGKVPFFYKQNVVNGKKISLPELDGKVWAEMPN